MAVLGNVYKRTNNVATNVLNMYSVATMRTKFLSERLCLMRFQINSESYLVWLSGKITVYSPVGPYCFVIQLRNLTMPTRQYIWRQQTCDEVLDGNLLYGEIFLQSFFKIDTRCKIDEEDSFQLTLLIFNSLFNCFWNGINKKSICITFIDIVV